MTPALRTAILDALMERWREGESEWSTFLATPSREYMSACLDMILPVAEPMIREAALREACEKEERLNRLLDWCHMRLRPAYREMFQKYRANPPPPRDPNEPPFVISEANDAILALGEPK